MIRLSQGDSLPLPDANSDRECALVFALGFGAGGYFGISQLATQLHGWWQARDWQPVPAKVLATELKESHSDDISGNGSLPIHLPGTQKHTVQSSGADVFLDAGADAGAFESHGWSALHYAARCGDVETLKTFARHHIGLDNSLTFDF